MPWQFNQMVWQFLKKTHRLQCFSQFLNVHGSVTARIVGLERLEILTQGANHDKIDQWKQVHLHFIFWKSFPRDFCPERLKRTWRQSRTYLHSSNDHPFQKCLLDPFISCFTSLPGHTADTYNTKMHETMPTCLRMARVTAWHASAWEEIELVLGVKPGDQGK